MRQTITGTSDDLIHRHMYVSPGFNELSKFCAHLQCRSVIVPEGILRMRRVTLVPFGIPGRPKWLALHASIGKIRKDH